MSRFKHLILATLASLVVAAAYAEARCPGNVASLALCVVESSLIVVQVEINQVGPYDFLVDTGAQITTIEPSLASELHLSVEGYTGVSGVEVYARREFVYLNLVAAGTNIVPDSLAVIQDMPQLKAADASIRGILGGSFLDHFDLLIDNRRLILCLESSGDMASAVNHEKIALVEPLGSPNDLPFTRPIVVSARLSKGQSEVLLRLDSSSNTPLLYATGNPSIHPTSQLKRVVDGVEQRFAVLPTEDIQIGKRKVRQVSFVLPLNSIGGGPNARENGLLPTMAFQRVFISYTGRYAELDNW